MVRGMCGPRIPGTTVSKLAMIVKIHYTGFFSAEYLHLKQGQSIS